MKQKVELGVAEKKLDEVGARMGDDGLEKAKAKGQGKKGV